MPRDARDRAAARAREPLRRIAAAVLSIAATLALLGAPGAGCGEAPPSPSGRTIFVGCDVTDPTVFDSASPVRVPEEPKRLVIFDPRLCPSGYSTPWFEDAEWRHLRITRPSNGASFPRNIAPPEFRWEDALSNAWMLSLTAPGWPAPLRVVTTSRRWRPDSATWEAVKSAAEGAAVELELRGVSLAGGARAGDVCANSIRFRVSKHPADPIVVYRLVSPLFNALKTPNIHYRDISNFNEGMFLDGKRMYCTNCHCFSGGPGVKPSDVLMGIAVRNQVDHRKLYEVLGLYNFASKTGRLFEIKSFFMSWDPTGRMLAVTGGTKIRMRPLVTLETPSFYIEHADIIILDSATGKFRSLPGASTREYMESMPTWSPDGSEIVFARAKEMGADFAERMYSLYRIKYNGGEGSEPVPVPGAADNGRSNYNPRFSPDGRWIVFNQADIASLVAPTSDLWILSTKEGALPRKLECNAPQAADSHHAWSSNGRWLVFVSKRDDGNFAKLYFTEIDDEGHASPPVELPTLSDSLLCYNVPEFLQYRVDINPKDILLKTTKPEDNR